MQFSTKTIIAISALSAIANTAPTHQAGAPINTAVSKLDSNGKVTWSQTNSGGRTAQISFDDIAAARANTKIKPRGGTDSDVWGWQGMGQIADYAASYACQSTGTDALSSTISASATEACKALVDMIPGAPMASKVWNVYQGAKAAANDEGNQVQTLYRFFYKTAAAPKLNEAMCESAMTELTTVGCQGAGGSATSTQGGEVRIGGDNDYIQIGVDPGPA